MRTEPQCSIGTPHKIQVQDVFACRVEVVPRELFSLGVEAVQAVPGRDPEGAIAIHQHARDDVAAQAVRVFGIVPVPLEAASSPVEAKESSIERATPECAGPILNDADDVR